ncbi:MAG: M24 family metallopeptidase [Aestuariivirgaceae bacterium]
MTASLASQAAVSSGAPFDVCKLDSLMDEWDLDALLISSKHNVSYFLGGYRFFFFDYMDAIGLSRYLPIVIYVRGQADMTAYVGHSMEAYEKQLGRFWMPNVITGTWGTLDAMQKAIDFIKSLNIAPRKIGVEAAFLPGDAYKKLESNQENVVLVDALILLERLRARKTKAELALLREASDRVIDSMLAVFGSHGPGTTKRELAEALRREEVTRGLIFEYCLVTTGTSSNRSPSEERWREGEIASLDSGGNYKGYIGDLCRMGILGAPDQELQDLLGEIEEIQQAARKPIRPGTIGKTIFLEAERLLARSANREHLAFVAHGMGLVSHEAPRLTSTGPVPYPGDDAEKPLEEGMVLSIETTLHHPRRGFIKLEDTVAVTADGHEAYGDRGRGWNRAG